MNRWLVPICLAAAILGYFAGRVMPPAEKFWWTARYRLTSQTRSFAEAGLPLKAVVAAPSASPRNDRDGHNDQPSLIFTDSLASKLLKYRNWAELEFYLARWAANDPLAAIEWTNTVQGKYRNVAMAQVLLSWMSQDPENALSWIRKFQREVLSDRRLFENLANMGRFDLGMAAVNDVPNKFQVGTIFFRAWVNADPGSARTFLKNLAPTDYDNWFSAALTVLPNIALGNLSDAFAMADANSKSKGNLRLLYREIARGLIEAGKQDSLLDWARTQQNTPGIEGIYMALAGASVKAEPERAVVWLNNIHDPDVRASNLILLDDLQMSRPDLAAPIIEQLTDSTSRNVRLAYLVEKWAQRDPAAALAYLLQTTRISAATREALVYKLNAAMRPL